MNLLLSLILLQRQCRRGAGAGHVLGFWQRHERRLGYRALDEARIIDAPIREDELSRTLLARREESRARILEALRKK